MRALKTSSINTRLPKPKSSQGISSPQHHQSFPTGWEGLRVRRFLIAAMEQQMWFFGCDAACADGNLLVHYGFRRYQREQPRGKSSCYRFLWRPKADPKVPAAQVDLHGWCAGLHPLGPSRAEGGFLYLRARHRLGWYETPKPPAPGDDEEEPAFRESFRSLGRRPEAGFCRSATLFLEWVAEYENWIETACGPRYRQRCFERAPLPWLPPSEGCAWLARYRHDLSSAFGERGAKTEPSSKAPSP